MILKKTETFSDGLNIPEKRRPTRIRDAPPDLYDPSVPRLGRRESEPHSAEVTYLYDVLTTNFPEGRAVWDLHHYFWAIKGPLKEKEIDIQFDVSFFIDLKISHTISSYKASEYDGKIPDLAINVLSTSTWRNDISENVDKCKDLGIPVYAVFSPYEVTTQMYHPPFLRVFILQEDGTYLQEELRDITLEEGGTIVEENVIKDHDILPFSLGLMRLKQEHAGKQSLYRLVLIDPIELRVFPTDSEKKDKIIEKKDKIIEKKDKIIEKKDKELEENKKIIEQLKAQIKRRQ